MKTRLDKISGNIFLLLSCLVFLSCKNSPVEPEIRHGIIWGQSIEGVRIGDDSATVVKKLGPPTEIGPMDSQGIILNYTNGDYAYLFVGITYSGRHTGVTWVEVEGPYKGRINGGVGLGSARPDVFHQLGTPDTSMAEMPSPVDVYEFDQCGFSITYDSLKVLRMAMGTPRSK